MKRKLLKKILIFVFIFLLFSASKVQAAYFKFDKEQVSVAAGEEFDLQVIVDPEGEEITSVDIYVKFDENLLQALSVEAGSYFPSVPNKDISNSTVYIAALVDDPASPKTGVGTVATIKFKGKNNGNTTISFDCDSSKIVKNEINFPNILTCSKNKSAQILIGQSINSNTNNSNNSQQSNSASANELPRTGIWDETKKFFVPGLLLFFSGLLGKFLLKL